MTDKSKKITDEDKLLIRTKGLLLFGLAMVIFVISMQTMLDLFSSSDPKTIGTNALETAQTALSDGNYTQAADAANQALTSFKTAEHRHGIIRALLLSGEAHYLNGNTEKAQSVMKQVRQLAEASQSKQWQAEAQKSLATLLLKIERYKASATTASRVFNLYMEADMAKQARLIAASHAHSLAEAGQQSLSWPLYLKAIDIAVRNKNEVALSILYHRIAASYAEAGKNAIATHYYERAAKLYFKLDMPEKGKNLRDTIYALSPIDHR